MYDFVALSRDAPAAEPLQTLFTASIHFSGYINSSAFN